MNAYFLLNNVDNFFLSALDILLFIVNLFLKSLTPSKGFTFWNTDKCVSDRESSLTCRGDLEGLLPLESRETAT